MLRKLGEVFFDPNDWRVSCSSKVGCQVDGFLLLDAPRKRNSKRFTGGFLAGRSAPADRSRYRLACAIEERGLRPETRTHDRTIAQPAKAYPVRPFTGPDPELKSPSSRRFRPPPPKTTSSMPDYAVFNPATTFNFSPNATGSSSWTKETAALADFLSRSRGSGGTTWPVSRPSAYWAW